MSDDGCDCVDVTNERNTGDEPAQDRWLAGQSVLDAELPADVRATLGRFLGVTSVETLGEWVTEVRHRTGGAISVDDLCHAPEPTDHYGVVDGEVHYFRCFYDAVILAALTETPVEIHTEGPSGTVIEATAVGTTGLTVTPADAVFSFGVSEAVEPPSSGEATNEDVYRAVCPYVRAFPNPGAYERWAVTAPAATVATPLRGATELAARLVE